MIPRASGRSPAPAWSCPTWGCRGVIELGRFPNHREVAWCEPPGVAVEGLVCHRPWVWDANRELWEPVGDWAYRLPRQPSTGD